MLESFFAAVFGTGLTGGVLLFLTKGWIETRLKESVKHEYDQKLTIFKQELEERHLQRQKVELVSELIAEWMAYPPGEVFTKEHRTRLNRLSFQATLWLPRELAIELGRRLQNTPDAKSAWELILFARDFLTGDDSLTVENVTFWGAQFEKPHAAATETAGKPKPEPLV